MYHPSGPPSIPIASLELPPLVKGKLLASGHRFVNDLDDMGPAQLAREIDITPREALLALKIIRQHGVMSSSSPTSSSSENAIASRSFLLSPSSSSPSAPSTSTSSSATLMGRTSRLVNEPTGKTALELLREER